MAEVVVSNLRFLTGKGRSRKRAGTTLREVMDCECPNCSPSRKSTEIADEDYVAALVAFGEQQLPAVPGPGKIKNTAGGKVRDLLRISAD